MHEPIISVSGLRGVVGQSLTPPIVSRYVAAFAAEIPPGKVLVARDGRSTGPWVADVVCGALQAAGRDAQYLGVAATPTVGVLVKECAAAGGIQISASHNPPAYNGLKLFGSDGRILSATAGAKVLQRYQGEHIPWAAHDGAGRNLRVDFDTTQWHWSLIAETVDVDRIRAAKFKVLLDANHGSGSLLGHRLLQELGCEVVLLGAPPDGNFEHPPEPIAENLQSICKRAPQSGVHVAFCQDPDADRLAVIDEHGRYLGEEYTLAICAKQVLTARPGPVVINCASSRMTKDIAESLRVPCFVSPVGEANVVDRMLAENAIFGGEGSGGAIDPRVVLVRDSFVSMAIILDAMAARSLPVSVLADELPRYSMVKDKYEMPRERASEAFEKLIARFADGATDRQDGLRFDWPDRWLLVRASNTEPIVRAIAEAPTPLEAKELCRQAGDVLKKLGG